MQLLLVFVCSLVAINAKKDCLTVRGNFQCNVDVPIFMQLLDRDVVTKHDIMDEMCPVTIATGSFSLYGCASDMLSRIDPELHIYHKCKGNQIYKIELEIPRTALDGEYNFTQMIDLNGPFDGESTVSKFPDPDGCSSGFKKFIKKALVFIWFVAALAA